MRRTPPVALTALLTLLLGLLNIWRLVGLLRERPLLAAYGAGPSLTLAMGLAALAGVLLPLLALLAWRRAWPVTVVLLPAVALYSIAYTQLNGVATPTLLWHSALVGLAVWAAISARVRNQRHIPPWTSNSQN